MAGSNVLLPMALKTSRKRCLPAPPGWQEASAEPGGFQKESPPPGAAGLARALRLPHTAAGPSAQREGTRPQPTLGPSHTPRGAGHKPPHSTCLPRAPHPHAVPALGTRLVPAPPLRGTTATTFRPAPPVTAGPLRGRATVLAAPSLPASRAFTNPAAWPGASSLGPFQPFAPDTSRKTQLLCPPRGYLALSGPGPLPRLCLQLGTLLLPLGFMKPHPPAGPSPTPSPSQKTPELKGHRVPWV